MSENNKPAVHSDPYLEVLANRGKEPKEASTRNNPDTAEIVVFFILWVVFAGLITWGAIDMGIHVVLSVLIGVVAGFIAAVIAFILGMAGIQF